MFEWSRPLPAWSYVVLGIGLVCLVVLARRMAISPQLRRWSLFLPRLGVFAAMLLILMNPVTRRDQRLPADPPGVVFLLDGSRSMALDHPTSRLQQARQIAQMADSLLTGDERPAISWFQFGEQLAAVPSLNQVAARDNQSQLAAALTQLPSRFGSEPPRAVVVFSDGTVAGSLAEQEFVNVYRQLAIPVHVVPLGDAGLRGDIALQDLVVPANVDRGVKAPVRAVVRSQGYAGERALVEIRPSRDDTAEPLASLPITLTGTTQEVDLVVEANPDLGELVIEIPLQDGEAIRENNRVPFQLAARSRKIRVIYMEGTGSNEYRWVQNALAEDKDIECLSMVADQQYVERPRLVRVGDQYKGFPATREELLGYDCIICSDISRGAFTREQLDWTVELVAQRGGGFAMVGGITSFGAGGWDQTVWDQLIPVDMRGDALGRGWLYHNFRVAIPADVQTHPIWRILEEPDANQRALTRMPQFLGTNYMLRLKPAATALAYSATPIPNAGIMPVMAVESYGRGRTFAMAPDTTADWGRYFESQWGEGDNRYFRKFWRNVVRWLTENSSSGSRRLQVETDRILCRPGQKVTVTARAYDEQLQETQAYQLSASLASPPATAGQPNQPLEPLADSTLYRAELTVPSWHELDLDGTHRGLLERVVHVVARDSQRVVAETDVKLWILDDSEEYLDLRPQPEKLQALAERTGGKSVTSGAELADLLRGLPAKKGDTIVTRTPRWDRPFYLLLVLLLLSTEWILRRRAGFG